MSTYFYQKRSVKRRSVFCDASTVTHSDKFNKSLTSFTLNLARFCAVALFAISSNIALANTSKLSSSCSSEHIDLSFLNVYSTVLNADLHTALDATDVVPTAYRKVTEFSFTVIQLQPTYSRAHALINVDGRNTSVGIVVNSLLGTTLDNQ